MGMPNGKQLEIPNDGAGNAVKEAGPSIPMSDLVCAYDYLRGGTSTYAADLEASVSGRHWTVVTGLVASGDGVIGAHFNEVRVNVTTAGVLDPTDDIWYRGKS